MTQSENRAVHEVETDTNTNTSVTDKQFDLLCEQYYHAWFRYHPEAAVNVGVYDYAELLTSYEHDEVGALLVLNQKMLSALDEINSIELTANRQIDFRIIKGAISIELHDMEENDWRYRDPMAYLPVNAVYQLLVHPAKDVHQSVKRRLEKIPEYLRGAKVMLATHPERVVPLWATTAKEVAISAADFIRGLARHPLITAKFANPSRLQPLLDEAAGALNDFAKYLELEVQPRAEGKFASGHYRFKRLLNEKHFFDSNAEKILSFGQRLAEKTQTELLQKSENICGHQDIRKALRQVTAKHPKSTQLLDCYRTKMQAAHAWLLKADIVSMPHRQLIKVQQTPDFMRELIPFAAYQPPIPQDKEQRGLYYVTTAEDEALLAEHNDFSIDLTCAHEVFPGHHLQFVLANQGRYNTITRQLHASASMYEGWALYCEQLVFEQGLYNKKQHHFIMLRDRLWRALRIIIDVKIHTGQFSFDDAAMLLVEKLGFDKSQARAEINWYSRSAATPLCYAVGREIILITREIVGADDKTKLKEFHDALLSQGSIALPLVVQSVFGDEVWQQVKQQLFKEENNNDTA